MKYIIMVLLVLSNVVNANTIEFVVSGSPGGSDDTVTRRVAEYLEKKTNLKIVVVNKPGASHTIAYNYVSDSDKQVLIASTPMIMKHEVYNKLNELFTLGNFSISVFTSTKSNIRTLDDLIELSKKRDIMFGHGGTLSYSYVGMKTICDKAKCLEVPYKSGAVGMLDLMSNQIDAYCIPSYGSTQFAENDKLRLIHSIKTDKTSFKIFSKNLSEENKRIILDTLKSLDSKFFVDMGF